MIVLQDTLPDTLTNCVYVSHVSWQVLPTRDSTAGDLHTGLSP